ncbi:MAG: helix-turn-helix domain-containing protein [Steroidobacter sp.]
MTIKCVHNGEEARQPYHYKACGLDDVYLLSGYEIYNTHYGPGVSVRDVDALHRAIGEYLTKHKKILNGKEVRFLRKQMDLTQSDLGKFLGVTDQQVARYEKGESKKMPGAADAVLRMLYLEHVGGNISIRELLTELEDTDAPARNEKQVFAEEDGVWKPAIAA